VSRQQRAHPRAPVPLDLPVHCAIPAGAGVALEGQIMDISEAAWGSSFAAPISSRRRARSSVAGKSSVRETAA